MHRSRNSSPIKQMPQLPEEIWAIVASKMTTKEWMSVSHTCRTMYGVQPASITLMPKQIRDFRWLIKHWKQVRHLSLDVELTGNLTIAKCAIAMMNVAHQLSQQLKVLKLSAPVAEDLMCNNCAVNEYRMEVGDRYIVELGTKTCRMCEHIQRAKGDEWSALLTYFVQQASQVQTLSFKMTILDVPLGKTLKHLLINVKDDIGEQGCRSLQQLQCLETLYISHRGWGQKEEPDDDDDDYDELWGKESVSHCRRAKALDMRGSNGLSVVRFVMFAPEAVKVPPGCHVSIECDFLAFCEGREGLPSRYPQLHDACGTWHLHDFRDGYQSEVMAYTLSQQEPIANIISLRLDCTDFCSPETPFEVGQCLQNLRDLEIRSQNDVEVKFIAAVRLERFVVVAKFLHLEAPDLDSFAASIANLYFCVQREWCPMSAALLVAIKRRACLQESHEREAIFPADADREQFKVDACCCGACSKCLGLTDDM